MITGIEPVGETVEVIVEVWAISPATKGDTFKAVRSIHVILEKNDVSWKTATS